MILPQGNSKAEGPFSKKGRDNYLIINILLAGVVLLVFAYSGFYSPEKNNYPVTCIHQKITGIPCASCGTSHAFSLIVRGRIDDAREWNRYSVRVFLFFALQLIFRLFFSVAVRMFGGRRHNIIAADITLSILLFCYSFYPFIRQLWLTLIH
jgi:hypothetical protein